MHDNHFHLHLVSDSTGETVGRIGRAAVSQFVDVSCAEHFWNLVRDAEQMALVIKGIERQPGPVFFSVMSTDLRQMLEAACLRLELPCVAPLDASFTALADYLHQTCSELPGRQYRQENYERRQVRALHYAITHDDVLEAGELEDAQIILVGPPHTSKTPSCLYLANKGYNVANITLVAGSSVMAVLDRLSAKVDAPLIIGMSHQPDQLARIRASFAAGRGLVATDPVHVRQELADALRHYRKRRWPIIDIFGKSIEEIVAEIVRLRLQSEEESA